MKIDHYQTPLKMNSQNYYASLQEQNINKINSQNGQLSVSKFYKERGKSIRGRLTSDFYNAIENYHTIDKTKSINDSHIRGVMSPTLRSNQFTTVSAILTPTPFSQSSLPRFAKTSLKLPYSNLKIMDS